MAELAVAMRVSPAHLDHLDPDLFLTLIEVLNDRTKQQKGK